MRFGMMGSQTATVIGRKTGEPQSIPVIPVIVDDRTYLVSTRGEGEWVRNLRHTPTVTITAKGHSRAYTATEIPVAERNPVITAYRGKVGREIDQYWKKLPHAADHPVFALVPSDRS